MLIGDKHAQTGGKLSCHTQDKISGNTHGMTGGKTIWGVLSYLLLSLPNSFLNKKLTGFSFASV